MNQIYVMEYQSYSFVACTDISALSCTSQFPAKRRIAVTVFCFSPNLLFALWTQVWKGYIVALNCNLSCIILTGGYQVRHIRVYFNRCRSCLCRICNNRKRHVNQQKLNRTKQKEGKAASGDRFTKSKRVTVVSVFWMKLSEYVWRWSRLHSILKEC